MKKRLILLFLLMILTFIFAGCNKKDPLPEDRFATYVKLWEEQNFDKMYDFLSTESKDFVSKQDFVERYTNIYEVLKIDKLAVEYKKPEEETDEKAEDVQFPFDVTMESIAGEIAFHHEATLVKEEVEEQNDWFLNWDTTFIFPDLDEGEEVALSTIQPKRGNIYDRNGIPLAEEDEVGEIGLVPENMEGSKEDIIKRVSDLLGISEEKIEKEINASWVKPSYFVPLKKISLSETELRAKLGEIPGIQRQNTLARVYPFGEAAGLLTGNIAPITAEDIEKNPDKGYGNNDLIGRRGLERVLEDRLRGEAGIKAFIKKSDDTEVVLAEKEVQDGEDIQLTIDAILQSIIYEELKDKAGTAAVIHPLTGETLALVSSPSFDPNALSLGATNEQLAAWENDPNNPFLIRFNSTFAPGSVLKGLTAAIGLNEGAIDWNKTMDVKGLTWAKDNWGDFRVKRVTDPGVPVDLEKALMYSDNIYFAQAALALGNDKFTQGLKNFGFEEEIPFLYPTVESTIGTIDSEAALANSGYGQAQIEMSVLHLAATYTSFLNDGNMIKPVLEASEEQGQIWKENVMKKEVAESLNAALTKVIEDPKGTAHKGKIKGYPLAGKTGTAEYAKEKQGETGRENGWFVAYNTEEPELLIALMIEDSGSKLAVEKVKNIIEEYQFQTGSFRNP